jgi:hypothetical protein
MVYSAETLKDIKDGYSSRAFLELMLETLKANAEPEVISLHGKLIFIGGTFYQLLGISADHDATAALYNRYLHTATLPMAAGMSELFTF